LLPLSWDRPKGSLAKIVRLYFALCSALLASQNRSSGFYSPPQCRNPFDLQDIYAKLIPSDSRSNNLITLIVTPKGHQHLDDILISALTLERLRLTAGRWSGPGESGSENGEEGGLGDRLDAMGDAVDWGTNIAGTVASA
jgi:hypothetical protein